MDSVNTAAFLICFAALASYINDRWLKCSPTIGVLIVALGFSLGSLLVHYLDRDLSHLALGVLRSINFSDFLLRILLSCFLFAGALQLDLSHMWKLKAPIAMLSLLATLIAALALGFLTYGAAQVFGLNLGLLPCLVFGAALSPTDPIAVLGILKGSRKDPDLEMKISGEALFNDGIAVVLFAVFLTLWQQESPVLSELVWMGSKLFIQQAIGGVLFGIALGWSVSRLLRSIHSSHTQVILTLALVTGAYDFAYAIGISGPIAMIIAGLIVGNPGSFFHPINASQSGGALQSTRAPLIEFWSMVDEVCNSLLFALIGCEVLLIPFQRETFGFALLIIAFALLSRAISIGMSLLPLQRWYPLKRKEYALLTWGGLRGGLAMAMALALPQSMAERELFIAATYLTVAFSVLVQGSTFGHFAGISSSSHSAKSLG